MAIMQEIETKLQKGISVSTDEEVYYALLELSLIHILQRC